MRKIGYFIAFVACIVMPKFASALTLDNRVYFEVCVDGTICQLNQIDTDSAEIFVLTSDWNLNHKDAGLGASYLWVPDVNSFKQSLKSNGMETFYFSERDVVSQEIEEITDQVSTNVNDCIDASVACAGGAYITFKTVAGWPMALLACKQTYSTCKAKIKENDKLTVRLGEILRQVQAEKRKKKEEERAAAAARNSNSGSASVGGSSGPAVPGGTVVIRPGDSARERIPDIGITEY